MDAEYFALQALEIHRLLQVGLPPVSRYFRPPAARTVTFPCTPFDSVARPDYSAEHGASRRFCCVGVGSCRLCLGLRPHGI